MIYCVDVLLFQLHKSHPFSPECSSIILSFISWFIRGLLVLSSLLGLRTMGFCPYTSLYARYQWYPKHLSDLLKTKGIPCIFLPYFWWYFHSARKPVLSKVLLFCFRLFDGISLFCLGIILSFRGPTKVGERREWKLVRGRINFGCINWHRRSERRLGCLIW